jgi:hypothetical protein
MLVGAMLCSWMESMWRIQQQVLYNGSRDSLKNLCVTKIRQLKMSEIRVSIIYLLTKFQAFLTVNIVISSLQYSSIRSVFVRVLFLIRVKSKNEAHNQYRQNIVFQHPVALMSHLYRFTFILNATLYIITALFKYQNCYTVFSMQLRWIII